MDTVKVVVTIGDKPDEGRWMMSRCGCGRSGEELIADRVRAGRSKLNWGLELILTPSSLFQKVSLQLFILDYILSELFADGGLVAEGRGGPLS